MSDVVNASRRSPFTGVPPRDVVRDVVAAVALLVALPLPWEIGHRGSDLLWVVLTTVLALVAIVAPYAERAGVLAGGWGRLVDPATRLLCLMPYGLVALLYLVLDVARTAGDAGAVGGGLAVGLAGVVLAAAVPGPRPVIVSAVVVALGAVVTPVLAMLGGASWSAVVGALLAAVLVLGVLWLTVRRFLRDDEPAGIVLIVVGAAVALEIVFLGGGSAAWFESLHGGRYGLLLLPVVAAAAVPVAFDRAAAAVGEPGERSAHRWVAVAVQAFELMMLVGGFVAAVAVLRLVDREPFSGGLVEAVLRLVVGVLVVVLALLARRALLRDPRAGHSTAVGAACLVVVLGVVILVARAGIGTASRVEELLLALALPALVLGALLLPPSVRALLGAAPADGSASGPAETPGERPWEAQAPAGSYQGRDEEGRRPAAEETAVQQPVVPERSWQEPAAQEHADEPQGTSHGSRWRGTWAAGTDATQQMAPVRTDVAEQPAPSAQPESSAPEPVGHAAHQTQVLPPVADVPGSRWTADQALDPSTPLESLAVIVQEAPHLRPHVAANPSTYPALLDWLGALGDPAVDAALRTRR
ncbi:hypothetical protein GCM10023216_21110 [Isoptericola chiayiensis]|uniref:Uncharacterized protein n=1 Tax=Isoptericola chiayiensis TaxID=579446 RepID=A0ABP8YIB6_9MICO|nr:hypothetical protein [Isoptericola chiayiensis]NOW00339.1 hypothetical protein [Isoptericola chiayiensis]